MDASDVRRPDQHTRTQRLVSVVIDLELDALEPDEGDGWSGRAIAQVRREEERRGSRRLVL